MHCHRLRYEAARSLPRLTPIRRPIVLRRSLGFQSPSSLASSAASIDIADWSHGDNHRLWDRPVVDEAGDQRVEQPQESEQYETSTLDAADGQDASARVRYEKPAQTRETIADTILAEGTYETLKEAQDAVVRALLDKSAPEQVLFAFFRAAQHPEYLTSIPELFLEKVLDAIRPEALLLPYRDLHQDLHPTALRAYRLDTLERIFAVYHQVVDLLLTEVQYTRRKPYPWTFKALLDLARVTGNVRHARNVFKQLEMIPGYSLDIQDYNHLFEAICWDEAYTSDRHGLRVTPAALTDRNTLDGKRSRGYRTGNAGMKDQILLKFQGLQDAGLKPDATTYTHLMTAFGREGLIDDVKVIIAKAWDVDCDRVLRQGDQELLLENTLDPSHPMYPNADTLHAIAHVFSVNNNMSAALQIVDFFARKYDIAITKRVWTELLQWAYVLSTRRRGAPTQRKVDAKAGQIPLSTVMHLWQIMRSPPYEVRPTMTMLRFMIKTCYRRDARAEMLHFMLEASKLDSASRRKWRTSLEKEAKRTSREKIIDNLGRLQSMRDHASMSNFLRLILAGANKYRDRAWQPQIRHAWFSQTLPDIVGRFWRYKPPAGIAYNLPGGRVQFHPRQEGSASLRSATRSTDGLALKQHVGPVDLQTHTGFTRQQRLQHRHSQRQVDRGRPPKWTPAYHETDSVVDWAGPVDKAEAERRVVRASREESATEPGPADLKA